MDYKKYSYSGGMEEVKSIKALLDATKPFMDALPKDSVMAKIVAQYVDAQRVAADELEHNDAGYFEMAAVVSIDHGNELVDYYAKIADFCEGIPPKPVDSWDGCENE